MRGNANRRLEKLAAGEADALLLAVSGLERIGRADVISEILSVETMCRRSARASWRSSAARTTPDHRRRQRPRRPGHPPRDHGRADVPARPPGPLQQPDRRLRPRRPRAANSRCAPACSPRTARRSSTPTNGRAARPGHPRHLRRRRPAPPGRPRADRRHPALTGVPQDMREPGQHGDTWSGSSPRRTTGMCADARPWKRRARQCCRVLSPASTGKCPVPEPPARRYPQADGGEEGRTHVVPRTESVSCPSAGGAATTAPGASSRGPKTAVTSRWTRTAANGQTSSRP